MAICIAKFVYQFLYHLPMDIRGLEACKMAHCLKSTRDFLLAVQMRMDACGSAFTETSLPTLVYHILASHIRTLYTYEKCIELGYDVLVQAECMVLFRMWLTDQSIHSACLSRAESIGLIICLFDFSISHEKWLLDIFGFYYANRNRGCGAAGLTIQVREWVANMWASG